MRTIVFPFPLQRSISRTRGHTYPPYLENVVHPVRVMFHVGALALRVAVPGQVRLHHGKAEGKHSLAELHLCGGIGVTTIPGGELGACV